MMRIAVVDDDPFFAEAVEKQLEHFFTAKGEHVRIWRGSSYALLALLDRQTDFQVYFLDVEMPGMNGLELAEKILTFHSKARIVLLTAYDRFALPGIRLGVYYYILKDDYQAELQLLLERICRETAASREEYYCISTDVSGYKICMDSILYLTKEKKYTIFRCLDSRQYKERDTLEKVSSRLPQDRFVKINRGIIVNMKHILSIERLDVTLRDKSVFPISRYEKTRVLDKLTEYWRKEY